MQNAKCKMQNGFQWLIGLMTIGLIIAIPAITHAIPGAKVLVVDNPNHRVFEINPATNAVEWEYGGAGILNYPNEAIPLTNGNILIADTYNGRVIEVTSDTRQIIWSYSTGLQYPVDIKLCTDYSGTPTSTLLITDFGVNKVMEVTYPGGSLRREISAISIGGTGDYLFWEAEKRPGMGTPTYLITCRSNIGKDSVMVVERQYNHPPMVTWRYGYDPGSPTQVSSLNDPRDANWTPCGNVLITDTDNKRVIEVEPTLPFGGEITWGIGSLNGYPCEAIRIENGNTLVVEAYGDDNKD
ncbi:MAG: hypothetical protein QME42_10940, partial [bacterium]|nr:hypothetical protein [bacterium]